MGKPFKCLLNGDGSTLHDQNLLAAKDLEIHDLQKTIKKLEEELAYKKPWEIETCVVDIFQSGDGSREKIRQREIAEWKENYYLNK